MSIALDQMSDYPQFEQDICGQVWVYILTVYHNCRRQCAKHLAVVTGQLPIEYSN
jgi:hypothetical protein